MLVANIVGAYVFSGRRTQSGGEFRVVQQCSHGTPKRGQVGRVRQKNSGSVGNLVLNATDRGADDR